jgi:diadenylate cyclase
MVIERRVGLEGLVEGGTRLGAEVSTRLLQTIFFPGTALHDLAVIIKGRVVHAAGVQLPMADPLEMMDPAFGARHRAALGLAKECDALIVVVSEETGQIRIAERGGISSPLDPDELRAQLLKRLQKEPPLDAGETAEEESERQSDDDKEKS